MRFNKYISDTVRLPAIACCLFFCLFGVCNAVAMPEAVVAASHGIAQSDPSINESSNPHFSRSDPDALAPVGIAQSDPSSDDSAPPHSPASHPDSPFPFGIVSQGAASRFDAQGAELPPVLRSSEADSELIRDRAGSILEHEQFEHVWDEKPELSFLHELAGFFDSFREWVVSLSKVVQWTIIGTCLLILTAIGLHLLYILRRVTGARASSAPMNTVLEELGPDPNTARERAGAAARSGNYSLALRHLHRYLRLALDRKGLLHYQQHWTNWEYLQAMLRIDLPAVAATNFTRRCDRVFYGGEEGTEADYAAGLEAVSCLLGVRREIEAGS